MILDISLKMLRRVSKATYTINNLQNKVKLPDRFKGTIIETWAKYWKNLFIDYRQMLQDLRTDIQDDPRKALKWTTIIITVAALTKNTPNEFDFRDDMKKITNEVILVSEDCRNPKSIEHLRLLQQCYNEGNIHYRNLGIIAFMYTSDLNASCDLYKGQCSYLQPTYLNSLSRIVDVGFMGRWWNIYIKTTNYDVNPETK
ncbi:mitochondrial import inner membrane translocase subunit Tim29 [Aricia agestis]|uniref:mitochondrial import inner membrane translocase subunit Tim29 n=1 Tax=Aricia agestis TaxID=91739 RepID=UPI001C202B53|nr:mitochondrial import inner membrane translocase subunit Tim29 [Aricia agestis]